MEVVWLVVIAVAVAIAVLLLIVWGIWQALLLRYQEEPDAHEIHTIKTKDGWELKLFRYKPDRENSEPVFLCHGAFANHTNFTKPRGACLVDTLLESGFDCWLIDFRGTRSSEPPLGRKRTSVKMDDYLLHDIPAALAFIRQVTGHTHVHWIGHSLGGMLLYAHVLLHGNHTIASGTTLGSPIGFVGTRIPQHRLLLKLARSFPNIAGALMRTGGRLGRALRPGSSVFPVNWRNLHSKVRGRDFFNMIETPPSQMTQELSDWATKKEWRMNDGELNLVENFNRLDLPLFAIYGAADPFVSVETALEFVERVPNPHKQVMILSKEDGFVEDYNHVDLAFGKEGSVEVYEPIAAWLRENTLGDRKSREDVDREGKAFLARRVTLAQRTEAAAVAIAAEIPAAKPQAESGTAESVNDDRMAGATPEPAAAIPPAQRVERVPIKSAAASRKAASGSKTTSAKKSSKPAAKKAAAKQTTAKKQAAKTKTTTAAKKKTTAKKKPTMTTTNKKVAAKKAATKKKTAAKKPTAKKAAAKKKAAPKKKTTAKKPAAAKKKTTAKKAAAAKKKTTAKRKPAAKKKTTTRRR